MAGSSEKELELLRFAAGQSRVDALDAIFAALETDVGHQQSSFLSVAAAKLRDAATFAGEANVLEVTGGRGG